LPDEGGSQESDHDRRCDGGAEPDMNGEIVGSGLAHCRRHDLDDPEDDGDFRDLVETCSRDFHCKSLPRLICASFACMIDESAWT
jgi:hypothetical protein